MSRLEDAAPKSPPREHLSNTAPAKGTINRLNVTPDGPRTSRRRLQRHNAAKTTQADLRVDVRMAPRTNTKPEAGDILVMKVAAHSSDRVSNSGDQLEAPHM